MNEQTNQGLIDLSCFKTDVEITESLPLTDQISKLKFGIERRKKPSI